MKDADVLFLHLMEFLNKENDQITIMNMDSLRCSPSNLVKIIIEREAEYREEILSGECIAIYGILGSGERVRDIKLQMMDTIRSCFEEILHNQAWEATLIKIKEVLTQSGYSRVETWINLFAQHVLDEERLVFPMTGEIQGNEWHLCYFWAETHPTGAAQALVDSAIQIWLEKEQPILVGHQLLIQSFLLRDLQGRRIITAMPEFDGTQWYLLVEGGKKVYLQEEMPYKGQYIGHQDIGLFSINDISKTLQNPVYAYGLLFTPQEVFDEWQTVFLYALALLPLEWQKGMLQNVYEKFLQFMANEICNVNQVPVLIEKEDFYRALIKTVNDIRGYLQGLEEPVISREYLLLWRSRYVYLETMFDLLQPIYGQVIEDFQEVSKFETTKFQQLLVEAELGDANQKGCAWEAVAEYILSCTQGLKITGRRVNLGYQEIDLCCVNYSTDEALWELGALILVECKNWMKKVDVPVIRSLSQVLWGKGCQTMLLFARSGITQAAEQEIIRQAQSGINILDITQQELLTLDSIGDFYDLLMLKKQQLDEKARNAIAILG